MTAAPVDMDAAEHNGHAVGEQQQSKPRRGRRASLGKVDTSGTPTGLSQQQAPVSVDLNTRHGSADREEPACELEAPHVDHAEAAADQAQQQQQQPAKKAPGKRKASGRADVSDKLLQSLSKPRFKGTGSLGLTKQLLAKTLTAKEAAALDKLPLPSCLERLERIFGAVNIVYGFLMRHHIQAAWCTVKAAVRDIPGAQDAQLGDLQTMAELCPRVVVVRDPTQ